MRRSTTGSASPNTARAARWCSASRTWRWPPATSGAKASASTRCAARTTCRARATWARSRTNSPVTATSPMPRRATCSADWGVQIDPEPGLRIPNMFEAALDGSFKALYVQGEDVAQSDPEYAARHGRALRTRVPDRAGHFPERDGQVRAHFLPGFVVPREGRHVHQRRTAHLARAQGHATARRPGGLGSHRRLCPRARLSDGVRASVRDHGRDRAPDADVHGRLVREARPARQHPVAVQ